MKKKSVVLIVIVLLLSALFAGCAGGEAGGIGDGSGTGGTGDVSGTTGSDAGGGITLTDMTGREVSLAGPATKVVALTAADVEVLYAIGAGDALVGRGEYCDYPPEALNVQSVQSGSETNIEQIIALEPQLLIMSKMAQTDEQVQQLENAGVSTFVTDPQTIDETYTAIALTGQLVGKESEAQTVTDGMKAVFADLHSKAEADAAAGGEQKTIYFEVSPLAYGLWAAGSGTFMDEVAQLLGLKNIFDDVSGWAQISEEQVIERNPDYIMTISMYSGDGPTPVEDILSRAGWENITAVKDKAIFNLTENELSRPGPRLADGATKLYDFVYGGGAE